MGSVIDHIDCPNCGEEAWSDFYYKTGEEYTFCNHCGYNKSITIKNRDKKLTELTEDDWDISELANPYGAYRIEIKEAIGSHCGCLKSAEEFEELKTLMAEDIDKMEQFELSQFIDGKIVITDILEQLKNNSNG
jgi:ribosomal protein L37E